MLDFDKTLEKLEDNLTQDITWRTQELVNLQNEIDTKFQIDNQEVSFLVRGAIALIYAHWEGSIKTQLSAYVKFLNMLLKNEYIELKDYDNDMLDLLFTPIIQTLRQNTKEKRLKGIEQFKALYFEQVILEIDSKEIINTKSNLSFEVLNSLLEKFQIEKLDSSNKVIIEKLLKNRNAIAHGEKRYTIITQTIKDDIEYNIKKIDEFIKIIKQKILLKAEDYRN